MPGMDGLACLDRIMIENPRPVLMVSSLTRDGADVTLEALRLGAVDFVSKPEGPLSLHMEVFGPLFVAKVRAVAGAKLKASLRLRERVQHRIGASVSGATRRVSSGEAPARATGNGIVVVGTSTGGPPALEALLGALPSTFPWPIVIAQHMPANFTGALARRLDGLCAIGVSEVARPTVLEPGHAYIGRGDADVVISKIAGDLVALQRPPTRAPGTRAPTGWWRAPSRMFRSRPPYRRADDRHGRRWRWINDETSGVGRADDRRGGGNGCGMGHAGKARRGGRSVLGASASGYRWATEKASASPCP